MHDYNNPLRAYVHVMEIQDNTKQNHNPMKMPCYGKKIFKTEKALLLN